MDGIVLEGVGSGDDASTEGMRGEGEEAECGRGNSNAGAAGGMASECSGSEVARRMAGTGDGRGSAHQYENIVLVEMLIINIIYRLTFEMKVYKEFVMII